jgi:crotonobetainyl-CoA:carnitine CoA-transferase CaiB-like acyl-CoA transferase
MTPGIQITQTLAERSCARNSGSSQSRRSSDRPRYFSSTAAVYAPAATNTPWPIDTSPRMACAARGAAPGAHLAEIDTLLGQWLATCDADETAVQLQRAGVCAHVSWTMQDVADDAHLWPRSGQRT